MNPPARRRPVAAVIGAILLSSGLTGCDQGGPTSPPPVPAPSVGVSIAPAGSEGLNVRYLDADGKIQSLDVEDFPR